MRRSFLALLPLFLLAATHPAPAATGRVLKVLPQFLDLQGRHALSPSLFDRDAYQAQLRRHPEQRSAVCFNIQWRARAATNINLQIRVELRGLAKGNPPRQATLQTSVKASPTSRWTRLTLGGDDYKNFGDVTAWRVTLWEGDQLLGEQKSFLW